MLNSHPKGVITKGKGSVLIELLTAFITYHYEVILYNIIFTVPVLFFNILYNSSKYSCKIFFELIFIH